MCLLVPQSLWDRQPLVLLCRHMTLWFLLFFDVFGPLELELYLLCTSLHPCSRFYSSRVGVGNLQPFLAARLLLFIFIHFQSWFMEMLRVDACVCVCARARVFACLVQLPHRPRSNASMWIKRPVKGAPVWTILPNERSHLKSSSRGI